MNFLKKIIPLTITLALFFVLPIKGQTTDENYSLSFDGVDDYVSVPSNSVYTVGDNYTIEAWFNSSSSGLQSLIQGWYGFGFQIYLTKLLESLLCS